VSQLALPVSLRDGALFETFVSARNEQAVKTLADLAPEVRAAPLWLWGPPGAGKSHLLQATCARASERGWRSIYLSDALEPARQPDMLLGLEGMDLVALDDIQVLAGDTAWERRLFHLCNELAASGGRLLLAANGTPLALPFVLPDLASRLAASLQFQLYSLDEPGRVAALALHAQRRGLQLPEGAAYYLLRRVSRDMNSLCDWLATLDAAALAAQRRLTIPFIRQVLRANGGPPTGE
jgi:DnaA family protein